MNINVRKVLVSTSSGLLTLALTLPALNASANDDFTTNVESQSRTPVIERAAAKPTTTVVDQGSFASPATSITDTGSTIANVANKGAEAADAQIAILKQQLNALAANVSTSSTTITQSTLFGYMAIDKGCSGGFTCYGSVVYYQCKETTSYVNGTPVGVRRELTGASSTNNSNYNPYSGPNMGDCN